MNDETRLPAAEAAHNPYQAPTAMLVEPEAERVRARPDASRGRRFGTFLVDYAGMFAMMALIFFVLGLVFALAGLDDALETITHLPDLLVGVLATIAYYLLFEGLFSRTPGKFLFGTIVVDEEGGRPGFKRVLGRTLLRFVPFEAFTFFGERGLHDRASGTRVVLARDRG